MENIDTKFKSHDGRLTQYAISCGYTERKSTDTDKVQEEDLYTELRHIYGHYQVRQFDRRQNAPIFMVFSTSFENDDFERARALFDAQPGSLVA